MASTGTPQFFQFSGRTISNTPRQSAAEPAKPVSPPSKRVYVIPKATATATKEQKLATEKLTSSYEEDVAKQGLSKEEARKLMSRQTKGRFSISAMTETYAAYGATQGLYKECARQAPYAIPQAKAKDGVIPKNEKGEDLGEGQGWWYEELGLIPTFANWAQITMLHMHLLIVRLRHFPASHYPPWPQHLTDHFFYDAEERMISTHNLNTNMMRQRYLKDLFVQWRGLQASYDEGLVKGDAVLAAALWRNLWQGADDVDGRKLVKIVAYMRRMLVGLEKMSDAEIATGQGRFGKLDWKAVGLDVRSPRMGQLDDQPDSTEAPPKQVEQL
ncbi:MAG: Protein cbp3, mitochondrial [Vezdaea aestivalis]|nr:MAG: Protein cbp3, mitochondrial [Vezdaea aestivalis]